MATFIWKGKTKSGDSRKGEIEAANKEEARTRLEAQKISIDKLKKKPQDIVLRMPGSTGITTRDMVIFTKQFSTMIDAGLPLIQCLDLLGTQNENQDFKKVILDVKATVETGTTLAEALGKHPKVFNTLFVNLVAAGEAGGVLDVIMNRLSMYIEKNMKLVKQVKGAMTYPIMVITAATVVTLVLLIFVIPVFQKMFTDFGAALPAPTQIVVNMSEFVRANVVIILGSIFGGISGTKYILGTKTGREIFDRALIHAPIVGNVVKKVAVAKFARTLATMLSSGVSILDALDIVASTSGNVVIEAGLRKVKQKISEGQTMAQPLSELPVFPNMVVQMIAVGETTGALDTMLGKIADFYDDEVDDAVTGMMNALEPLIMAGLAVLLGGLVVAMYLPVFTLAGSIG